MTRLASLGVLEAEPARRLRPVTTRLHVGRIAWSGTSDKGKPGLPNTKLAKKVRKTPLAICRSGLKSGDRRQSSSDPTRQARPRRQQGGESEDGA